MMQTKSLMITIMLLLTATVSATELKVIYGIDNRRDFFEVSDSKYTELSRSTAAMMSKSSLITDGDVTTIKARSLKSAMNLCEGEAFAEQPAAAKCSGFLVGPDTFVTAGHCIRTQSDCDSAKFVFDFKSTHAGQTEYEVATSSVYSCKSIVETVLNSRGGDKNDYAVITLDRKVTDRQPLKFRTTGTINAGDEVVVMGHPSGIPLKVADGGYIRDNSNEIYFSANLDTYGGNSGSAVFNATTGEVEGILVRGARDYIMRGSCRVSNVCDEDGCGGESVTRITAVAPLMK